MPVPIPKKYQKRFREIFRRPLEHFWDSVGFKVFDFGNELFPKWIETEGKSLDDFIREKYGSEGLDLIDNIISEAHKRRCWL